MRPALAALVTSGAALLVLVLAGPLARTGAIAWQTSMSMFRWSVLLGALGLVATVAAAFQMRRHGGTPAVLALIVSAISAAIAIGVPLQWAWRAASVPRIHDVTTDPDDPPAFAAVLARRGPDANDVTYRPETAQKQRQGYPDLAPLRLARQPAEAFAAALAAAHEQGWEIVAADDNRGVIEATATTRWFGFRDDVVVRLRADGGGTRVDVRSASRAGISDLGTNARRIREYLDAIRR